MEECKKQNILDVIGGFGPWQRRIFFTLFIVTMSGSVQILSITFLAPDNDFWCARIPDAENISVEEWKHLFLPENDKHCTRYINAKFNSSEVDTNATYITCDAWEYDDSFYSSTILSEWNLVCGKEWLVSLSKSIFMIGLLVSGTFTGLIADKWGRRPTIAGFCFLVVFASTVSAFSVSYTMFITARFFIAIGSGGYYSNFYVLLIEVLDPHNRLIYGNLILLAWCLSFPVLSGIAWLLRDWFWIQISITALCTPYLFLWWIIPESPRWLLQQGRIAEAKTILKEAAEMNGKKGPVLETELEAILTQAEENFDIEETKGRFIVLVRNPVLRRITLIVFYSWFVLAFIYFGLTFNTNELAGDPFLNFCLSGLVEIPAYLLSIFVIKYFGRKRSAGWSLLIGGVFCLTNYFVPHDIPWLSVTVSLVGKYFVCTSYAIMYLFTSELLPTVVRNTIIGFASSFEQAGGIVAPFVHELGIYAGQYVPFAIFGLLATSSGILIFFLPETCDKAVPDTFKEAVDAFRTNENDVLKVSKTRESQTDLRVSNV